MAKTSSRKIGFVLDDSIDKSDGVQQYVLTLGAWMRSQGHDVHYLVGESTRTDLPGMHSLAKNMSVRFNHNRMSMPLPADTRAIAALLAAEQFDVIHVQIPYSPWLAHRVLQQVPPETAVIGTFHVVAHSSLVAHATRALAVWTRRSTRRFDRIFSVSPAAQQYAKKTYGIQTTVLPNVVSYKRFNNAAALPAYADGTLTILFLGRLVERKGCRQLLQAIARLTIASLPKYRVVICGTGPLETSLKQFVAVHHLDDIVQFVGYVSEADKPAYYASADIAVFPSTGGESFGIVLLEAMASGAAAVLAGDNVGYTSVLAPMPELLFDPFDVDLLRDKLINLLQHPAERSRIARWGRTYTKRFDTSVVGTTLLEAYGEALRKRHGL